MASTLINEIMQDHLGVIWIATDDGLTRYDGSKFTTYRHIDGDETSISHNLVRDIIEDKAGNIYVGTHNGLQHFCRNTNTFSTLAKDSNGKFVTGNVNKILQLSNGEIWVSGNDLYRVALKDHNVYAQEVDYPGPRRYIQDIMEDNAGNIWVSHQSNGIFVHVKKGNRLKHYLGDVSGVTYRQLESDEEGNVFVGTIGMGVLRLNTATDRFETISGTEGVIPTTLDFDGAGKMYIGTDGNGIKAYDIARGTLQDFPLDNKFFNSQKAKIHSILSDVDGNLWLGVYQKGVMYIRNKSSLFTTIGHKTFDRNYIGSEAVTGITEDCNGNIWITTDNDGIYRLSADGSPLSHFDNMGQTGSPRIILGAASKRSDKVWVASFTDGLGYYSMNGAYTSVPIYDRDGKAVRSVMAVKIDHRGRLWATTLGCNIFCIDTKTCRVIPEYSIIPGLNEWQLCSQVTKDGNIYVGTFDGMYVVSENNGKPVVGQKHFLQGIIVHDITEDRSGNLWVATSHGLARLDVRTGKVTTLTTAQGLISNTVYAVRCDDYGMVWATTSSGLAQFSPDMKHVANFTAADGIQGNEFSRGAAYIDSQGRLWAGGTSGVSYFRPTDAGSPSDKWTVRLTDFYLNNRPVDTRTVSGLWNVTTTNTMEATRFDLSSTDNSFSLEFAEKELSAPDGFTYEYTINDDEPVVLPAGTHRISFSNLSPGLYRIRIYVSGKPEIQPCEITVKIHVPWYNHWMAWIAYLVIFVCVARYVMVQYRQIMATRKALAEQTKVDEINRSKLEFFTNISHEIRTPMTLILSPLQKLMANDSDVDNRRRNYDTMNRNAKRILGLINELMDIRKLDNGKLKLTFGEHDVVPLIEDICKSFTGYMKEKNITFTYIHDGIDAMRLWIDVKNFDKMVSNILSNAMKFAPADGVVTVELRRVGGKAVISVSDNGIGIPDAEKPNIFNRFYQVNSQYTAGTGVGLHLTQALTKLHHGEIYVTNNEEGPGSKFFIELPTGREHLSEEELSPSEITEKTDEQIAAETVAKHEDAPAEENPQPLPYKNAKVHSQSKYKVLIVDDDEEISRYIMQELQSKYHCSICNSGESALAEILAQKPNLVISDIMMPGMSGIELCRQMKANVNINHIPIILLTALSDTQTNVEGLNVGAAAFLTKPFDVTLLKSTVNNVIQSRQRLKNVYEGKQSTASRKAPKVEILSPDERFMKRIMKVVEAHIFDQKLTVDMLASEVGVSRVHMNRKLKELTNQTSTDFIRNIRLKRAAELLSKKKHSIAEVADMVGFPNPNNFSTVFRKLYGMSPREYMNRDHSGEDDNA
ncbi:MAG: response regulator [Bacteroidaceae bacterium]|nr:response regulator [Bacteroidaceae bacterium]